ncbi:MAG: HEAT repeat domain-containing protein [Anaerolineae bacterium]
MSETLNALLAALADESRAVRVLDLAEISDLARSEVATFRASWDGLSSARRLELMRAMVEQAEANIHLNFHVVLRACLADDDPQIRVLAIEGLWEDEKIGLVRPLIELLSEDPAVEVRAAAATSLGRFVLLGVLGEIADAHAQEIEVALRAAWERFAEPVAVRRRALESLAYSSSSALQEMIHSAYYDEDELMRQSAVFAMGRSADARWARIVLTELHNHQPAMRFESAIAAGEMGLRAAVQPLIGRLDDPDAGVRQAAATALGKIGGPAARRALLALLGGGDEALAQAAEDALDELAFGSQHLDAGLTEEDGKPLRQRRGGGEEEEDELFDLDDDAFTDERALFGDADDEFTDLFDDEVFDGEDDFGPEDEDDEFAEDEEGWSDEDDDLDWR